MKPEPVPLQPQSVEHKKKTRHKGSWDALEAWHEIYTPPMFNSSPLRIRWLDLRKKIVVEIVHKNPCLSLSPSPWVQPVDFFCASAVLLNDIHDWSAIGDSIAGGHLQGNRVPKPKTRSPKFVAIATSVTISARWTYPSWWFQPTWKILVKLDHFPRKMKNIWNHHLVSNMNLVYFCWLQIPGHLCMVFLHLHLYTLKLPNAKCRYK